MRLPFAMPFIVGLVTPALALETGRSANLDPSLAFEDCRPYDEVCGVMSTGTYRSFVDRCEARAAGARRILYGVCEPDD